ncbi:MAG: hypothetical protein GXY24_01885 [Bacteroidales bacterium]|jgi:hypothetical protein|nr:hypothetical protein [Bacteroidales bacterium]
MKKTVAYILAGVLTLLGFSSCANLRQARLERQERERMAEEQRKAQEQWQRDSAELARQQFLIDSLRQAEMERNKLLYAVPNVPYQDIEDMK